MIDWWVVFLVFVGVPAWLVVSTLAGIAIGKMIKWRDRQVPRAEKRLVQLKE